MAIGSTGPLRVVLLAATVVLVCSPAPPALAVTLARTPSLELDLEGFWATRYLLQGADLGGDPDQLDHDLWSSLDASLVWGRPFARPLVLSADITFRADLMFDYFAPTPGASDHVYPRFQLGFVQPHLWIRGQASVRNRFGTSNCGATSRGSSTTRRIWPRV